MPTLTAAQQARREAQQRLLREIYGVSERYAGGMHLFSLTGFIAAALLVIFAFVLVATGGAAMSGPALRLALLGAVSGAMAFLLLRSALNFRLARKNRDFRAFVEAVGLETAYWRTAAGVALAVFLLTSVPPLLHPFQRAASRMPLQRTVSDMRVIGAALEKYATRHHGYPNARSYDQLGVILTPFSDGKPLPLADGWGTPYTYAAICHDGICHDYRLASAGANARFDIRATDATDRVIYTDGPGGAPLRDPDVDIVHGNGHFILVPEEYRRAGE